MTDETQDSDPSPNPSKPDALELVCAGILRTEFGRRPSRAVSNAILRLTAEEAMARPENELVRRPASWRERVHHWLVTLQPRPALALVTVLVLVTGLSFYYLKSYFSENQGRTGLQANGKLTDALGMQWAKGSPALKVGADVPPGILRLEAGVVEITFADGAKAAVEGPAQFKLTSGFSMELESGKIATEVPKRAKGFTVATPTATVVDLGTRFGAIVGNDKSSEVDVFQGRVKLTTADKKDNPPDGWRLTQGMAMFVDEHGATPANVLPETAFPQPNVTIEVRPQNCGFDVSGRAAVGDVPVDFGYWSGQDYSLTTSTPTVIPANGPGMLEFNNPAGTHGGDSEVWQLIDLRPYKKLLEGGQVEAKLTAQFNRNSGDADSGDKFGLTLAAFHGSPAESKALWAARQTDALALADKELVADGNPATWEPLEAVAKLPPKTDFVIVQIRALTPKGHPGASLAGHFADLVDLRLSTPMRSSSIAIK